MREDPAAAPAQKRRAQNNTGIGIVGAALAYQIEGEAKYLEAAKRYMDAAVSYPVWGYTYSKPDIDLAAGHLLYGLGAGYDLLYDALSDGPAQALPRQAGAPGIGILAKHFMPAPGKSYSYSQNHCFIPVAGLAVAAYALWDEAPEAAGWAALSRAIFSRVLEVASPDGYFYEGVEYWIFSMPWIIHALDAFAHAAGDDMYDTPALRKAHLYIAHSLTPNGQDVYDFGDVFEGPITRARVGEEPARTHPGGKLNSNYNLLYRLAARFRNAGRAGRGRLDGVARARVRGRLLDPAVARSGAEIDADGADRPASSLRRPRHRVLAQRLDAQSDRLRLPRRPARGPSRRDHPRQAARTGTSRWATRTRTPAASSCTAAAAT
jgi:hypothetical protein